MKSLPELFRRNTDLDAAGNPFRELLKFQRQMDRLFNEMWNPGAHDLTMTVPTPAFSPSCDIEETDSHYLMTFDLPGVKKDDIRIQLDDGILTVFGERKEEREEKNKSRYRSERIYGSFQRSFQLPAGVKSEQVETHYADGVLRIAVPRTEKVSAQQIKVGEAKPGFWDKLLGKTRPEPQKPLVQVPSAEPKEPKEKTA